VCSDCSDFISELKKCEKGYFLVRGVFEEDLNIQKFKSQLEYREPSSSSKTLHNFFNEKFIDMFGWKARNGVYSFGVDYKKIKNFHFGYGDQSYILMPIGKWDIVWSKTIDDLFNATEGLYGKNNIDEYDNIYGIDNDGTWKVKTSDNTIIDTKIQKRADVLINYKLVDTFWRPTRSFDEFLIDNYDKYLKNIVESYIQGDLNDAIKSSNEISLKCDRYYLIDQKYVTDLIKLIWGDEEI
jgi:hypothetical protein